MAAGNSVQRSFGQGGLGPRSFRHDSKRNASRAESDLQMGTRGDDNPVEWTGPGEQRVEGRRGSGLSWVQPAWDGSLAGGELGAAWLARAAARAGDPWQ